VNRIQAAAEIRLPTHSHCSIATSDAHETARLHQDAGARGWLSLWAGRLFTQDWPRPESLDPSTGVNT
jgi:hypothetical protein